MSLFSKIGKGIKKLKFKKVAPILAGAAALAIPGVGTAVAAGVGAVARGAGGAIKTAGGIVKTTAVSAGTLAKTAGSTIREDVVALGDTSQVLGTEVKSTATAASKLKFPNLSGLEQQAGANALQGAFASIPPIVWIGVAVLVLFFVMRRK